MENIGNLTVRAPIILKFKPAINRTACVGEGSFIAACLNDQLAEAHPSIVHDCLDEEGRPAYLADDDGTFTAELLRPDREAQVKAIITASGFQIAARYDAGWQT